MNAQNFGAIVPRSTISAVAQARELALAKMLEAMSHLDAAQARVAEAFQASEGAHRGFAPLITQGNPLSDLRREKLDLDSLCKAYRNHLDTGIWTFLIDHSGMGDMMDRQAKTEIRATFSGDVPEATEANMTATMESLFGQIDHIAKRGIAEAFSRLDRRFKSHNGFKIGSRIIITRICDTDSGTLCWGEQRDIFADVERAFAMVAGLPPAMGDLWSTISRGRRGYDPQQSEHESRFFLIRIFKNGNAHLWLTDKDLVRKVNKVLADWYGAVLPDAAPAAEDAGAFTRKAGLPSNDLQFYPTPPDVAESLCHGLRLDGAKVLEPEAGSGAICRVALAKGAAVTAVEIHEGRALQLRQIGGRIATIHANFLTLPPSPTFQFVLMNPPFYGTHWMEHVYRAWDWLAPGGTLRAVLPASAEVDEDKEHLAFRRWVERSCADRWHRRYFSDLPSGSFRASGTNIETVILEMRKKP